MGLNFAILRAGRGHKADHALDDDAQHRLRDASEG
jgi:hypothetical protein